MEKWNDFASLHQNKTFPAVIWPDKHSLSLSALLFFLCRSKNLLISKSFKMITVGVFLTFWQELFLLFKSKATQTALVSSLLCGSGIKKKKKNPIPVGKRAAPTHSLHIGTDSLIRNRPRKIFVTKMSRNDLSFQPTSLNKWTRMSPL